LTAANLTRFVEDAGGLQLDTINVVDRAHHLTLWSRFGVYDRAALDRLIYRRKALFEYWAHAACLVPASHGAAWRRVMMEYGARPHSWRRSVRRNQAVLEHVLEEIRARGPLSSADFEHDRRGRSSGWWDRKPQTRALDYLWMTGRLAVHSRAHFQKRYDLLERVLPDLVRAEPPETEVFRRWHLRQSLRAMGAATESDLRMYLTFPGITIAERRHTLKAMLREGSVREVAVADAGRGRPKADRWLALAEDLPALARAGRRRVASRGTTLLSPFDSLLWHRERVRRLFGYDYKIEVYVPAARRRHGYYSLPILHDGHLIGRVDPKSWREERRLEVRSVHFEPWFAAGSPPPAAAWGHMDREAALDGVGAALVSLADFVGADRVTLGRVSPPTLAALLGRALRSSSERRS
jgi:hypothetical protein